jgi:hypothetical protein
VEDLQIDAPSGPGRNHGRVLDDWIRYKKIERQRVDRPAGGVNRAITLTAQIEAGAEVLQFSSTAGPAPLRSSSGAIGPDYPAFEAFHPEIPVILFPRGAGLLYRVSRGVTGDY